MRILSFLFLILLVLIGITFAILNPAMVEVNYYLGQRSFPLSLLMISVFGVGGVFGVIASFWLILSAKIQNFHLRQRLKFAEKEIDNLRAIPLRDKH